MPPRDSWPPPQCSAKGVGRGDCFRMKLFTCPQISELSGLPPTPPSHPTPAAGGQVVHRRQSSLSSPHPCPQLPAPAPSPCLKSADPRRVPPAWQDPTLTHMGATAHRPTGRAEPAVSHGGWRAQRRGCGSDPDCGKAARRQVQRPGGRQG